MATYLSALIGFVLLAALYFSMKWEESQYEDIEDVMTETEEDAEISADPDAEKETDKLWEGTIGDVRTKIYKGWQRQIYVVVEQGFPFEGRVEATNFLRSTTRFFKETVTPRMIVTESAADDRLLGYSTDPEPMETVLRTWSEPEYIEVLQDIHHVEFDGEEWVAQFFHPDIDLEELTEKARAVVRLYRALPDRIKKQDTDQPEVIPESEGTDDHGQPE